MYLSLLDISYTWNRVVCSLLYMAFQLGNFEKYIFRIHHIAAKVRISFILF